jgi:uncharacterized protein YdeI (YjbR/CyaY-like superfamily)
MSPMDVSQAVPVASAGEFERWASGRQTVTFDELLDVALCHGWVDTQTKGIDDQRYAIRFVPRRPGSNWSATNRAKVRRLLAEGRMTPAGQAALPDDL